MIILLKNLQKITKFKEKDFYEIIGNLKLINCVNEEKQAKAIDLEYYNQDCFEIRANYYIKNKKLEKLGENNNIIYIDENGEINEIESSKIMVNNVLRQMGKEVKKFLADKEQYIENRGIDKEWFYTEI